MSQNIISGTEKRLNDILLRLNSKKYLLVCDASFPFLGIEQYIRSLFVQYAKFDGFSSNPLYEDVYNGVQLFNRENCDTIVAIGGGSAIDVAKCVKLFCKMDSGRNYLEQEYCDSGVPLIAMPTTAGTGSESTRYAVIYYEGKKQSVTHESIIPDYAVLNPGFLRTLPPYQKKCTMLDALCQGIESWWSVNSTDESKSYSKTAVETIMKYMDAYIFDNDREAAEQIMLAANFAGRAINITQTTAAHAMSYKLTSMYQIPHGHAVALCLPHVWRYMLSHPEECIDPRGIGYLTKIFPEIPFGVDWFEKTFAKLGMGYPEANNMQTELDILTNSVNPDRLKNNPVFLSKSAICSMYSSILK